MQTSFLQLTKIKKQKSSLHYHTNKQGIYHSVETPKLSKAFLVSQHKETFKQVCAPWAWLEMDSHNRLIGRLAQFTLELFLRPQLLL